MSLTPEQLAIRAQGINASGVAAHIEVQIANAMTWDEMTKEAAE